MSSPHPASVTLEEANSIPGATVGFGDATMSTAEEVVDLVAWKGRYVKLYCLEDGFHFSFMTDATTVLSMGAAVVGTVGIPDAVAKGEIGAHRVVPKGATFLRYRSLSVAVATLRVIPS